MCFKYRAESTQPLKHRAPPTPISSPCITAAGSRLTHTATDPCDSRHSKLRRTTPLILMAKFVFRMIVDKGRTVIIKMPLIRLIMTKGELPAYLQMREAGRSARQN
jgi:hypothetical protein